MNSPAKNSSQSKSEVLEDEEEEISEVEEDYMEQEGMDCSSTGFPSVCQLHFEPMRVFCHSCQIPICIICLYNGHTQHSTQLLEECVNTCRKHLEDEIGMLKHCKEYARGLRLEIDDSIQGHKLDCDNLSKEINYIFDGITKQLEQRRKELLDTVSGMELEKCEPLRNRKRKLEEEIERLDRVANQCEVMLKEGSHLEIVHTRMQVGDRILDHIAPSLLQFRPEEFRNKQKEELYLLDADVEDLSDRIKRFGNIKRKKLSDTGIKEKIAFKPRDYSTITGPHYVYFLRGEFYMIAVDLQGRLLATEFNQHFVMKLSREGERLQRIGSFGDQPGQFNSPSGIAVNSMGRIIVTDHANHR